MSGPMTSSTIAPEALAEEPEREPDAPLPSLDEDDRPRELWERSIGWGIVAIATLLTFFILDPGLKLWPIWHAKLGLLFTNTTTNGGDMGAHVWWPWFLERHWFAKGRLSGWAPDWYAGFPVGQYYFPMPAVMIAGVNWFLPYNVAFKLVTVSGPLMLPASAYYFAKGMRAPWPAPPAFALAAFGMLVETRNDWQIYGGNIASTLAGEFSFTIGLAFALFGLGALARTLDTGKRRWLPAVLIAAAVMSHVVIAIFVGIAALILWLTRRPTRTTLLALAVGGVAVALTAVWTIPLMAQQAYTQSMRYTKLVPKQTFKMWSWLPLPSFVRNPINGLVSAMLRPPIDTNASPPKRVSPTLWLPWWIWVLAGVAIVAAGWYRRRSTLVLLVMAFVFGFMFVEWPQDLAVWNTRFLPFWLFTWGLLAAMGATEICRGIAGVAGWAYRWIRDGDLQDARARAWAERATAFDDPDVDDEQRKDAAWALAERRFDQDPAGWEPPDQLAPARVGKTARTITTVVLSVVVAIGGIYGLNRAWDARDNNSAIVIHGWAQWNYSGYERKSPTGQPDKNGVYTTSKEFFTIMDSMNELARTEGNGRLLWEPGDALNAYGTTLSPELIPYYTDGRIGSMEGLYFESSATTDYHFLTVAECGIHPSNPVRGLVYGTVADDFDLCVKHLQMLGVRYLMLWTKEAEAKADANSGLREVMTIPDFDGQDPKGWKVYEVADSEQAVGLDQIPVVVKTHAGSYSKCWDTKYNDTSSPQPQLASWECAAAPWWEKRSELDTAWTASGPKDWQRIDASQLSTVTATRITPATVSNYKSDVDSISFDVSEIGKPILVRTSYFPNWKVSGAKGPYRAAPNLMVVVPTSTHVKLTYGLTGADWLGRFVTLLGIAGLVGLVMWRGAVRYAADPPRDQDQSDEPDDEPNGSGSGDEGHEPPDDADERKEPEPALP